MVRKGPYRGPLSQMERAAHEGPIRQYSLTQFASLAAVQGMPLSSVETILKWLGIQARLPAAIFILHCPHFRKQNLNICI